MTKLSFNFKPFIILKLVLWCSIAHSEIPNSYNPIVIIPSFSFTERVMDLTPAFERAKIDKKNIFIYFGAADCPPCKLYTIFLKQNSKEMEPVFSEFLIADIRTWLRGPKITFKIYEKHFTVSEFKEYIGDNRRELVYPTWWLLNTDGRQLRQLPNNSSEYINVESHTRVLKGI